MSVGPGSFLGSNAPTLVGEAVDYDDPEGTSWSVTEHDMRGVAGARGLRCLIFASRYTFRRVWHFPAEWRSLPPGALAELSWAH